MRCLSWQRMDLADLYRMANRRAYYSVMRIGGLVLMGLVCLVNVYGQSSATPSRTQCKQWDDSYLLLFNFFIVAGLLLPVALNTLLPPVLGRRVWFLASPRMRVLYISLIVAGILATVFVALPFVVGFGRLIFSGVDQAYFGCETLKFGATGLLFGLVGSGIAAISQWPAVLALLLASCVLGGLIAFLVSGILVKTVGLPSRVRGITA